MRPAPTGWKPAAVKRRLRQLEKALAALCLDLDALEDRIPVPSPQDLQRFKCGAAAFSPESVLLGVVCRSRSSLRETLVLISDMVSIPPDELQRWGLSAAERAIVLEEIGAFQRRRAGADGNEEAPRSETASAVNLSRNHEKVSCDRPHGRRGLRGELERPPRGSNRRKASSRKSGTLMSLYRARHAYSV